MKGGLPDSVVKVSFHVFEHQVQILIVFGPHHLLEPDDGAVLQFVEEGNLAEGALGVGGVLECIEYFLEGEGLSGLAVGDLPDVSVGSSK